MNPAITCVLTLIRALRRLRELHELNLSDSGVQHVPSTIWALLPKLRVIDISNSVFQNSIETSPGLLQSFLDVDTLHQFTIKHSCQRNMSEFADAVPDNVRFISTYVPPPKLCTHTCWQGFLGHHAVTPLDAAQFFAPTAPDSSKAHTLVPLDSTSDTSNWVLAAIRQTVDTEIPSTVVLAKHRTRMASLDVPDEAAGPWQPWRITIFTGPDGKRGGFVDNWRRGRVSCRGSDVWHFFGQTGQPRGPWSLLSRLLPSVGIGSSPDHTSPPPTIVPHRDREQSWGSDADVVSALGPFLWSFRSHAESAHIHDGQLKMARALDDPSWHQIGGYSVVSVTDLDDDDHRSMVADIAGIRVACSETAAMDDSPPRPSLKSLSAAQDRSLAYAVTLKHNPGLCKALLGSVPDTKDEFIRAGELLACSADAKFVRTKATATAKRLNVRVQAIVVSVKDALKSAERVDWEASIDKECGGLINENSVLRPCDPKEIPNDADVLPAMLVLTQKPDKKKARVVACGNFQALDGSDSFAPVVARDAWLTTMIIGLKQRKQVRTVDITQAFLQSDAEFRPDKPTFLRPNSAVQASLERLGFRANSLLEVVKSVYGLRSAPRSWQRTLNAHLSAQGFRPHELDPTVWIRRGVYILCYVDDLMCVGPASELDMFESSLKSAFKVGDFSTLGAEPVDFVGHSLWIDDDNVLHISQERLVTQFLARFGFTAKSKGSSSPMVPVSSDNPARAVSIDSNGLTVLRSVVGGSAFVAGGSRPDCMVFTSMLAEQQSPNKCSEASLLDCKKLLRYYHATRGRHATMPIKPWVHPESPEGLEVWADSNFSNSYSRGGMAIGFGGHAFLWRSSRHKLIVLSTCESELIGMSQAIRYAMGLQHFVELLLGIRLPKIRLFADNTAACCISQGTADLRKVRHLTLADLFIRQACADGKVSCEWIPTADMFADGLTKIPGKKEYELMARAFGLCDSVATVDYGQVASVEVLTKLDAHANAA